MTKLKKREAPRANAPKRSRRADPLAKPYWEMTTAELSKATAEFDSEFADETFGPPSAKQRDQLARAKRKRGRPRVGAGSKTISVTVEEGLLSKADKLAKKLHVPRAALIARGLRAVVMEEVVLQPLARRGVASRLRAA